MTRSTAPGVAPPGDHPAVRAWRQVAPQRAPAAVEQIQRRRRSQVYRIRWSGGSAIAKRCRRHMAAVEQAAYRLALPRARDRVRVPAYLGSLQDETSSPADPFTWMFIEDLGERRYRPQDPEQRAHLARWLGRLQAALLPATEGGSGGLPVRGADYYQRYLQQALYGLPRLAGARALPPTLLASIATVRSALQSLQDSWHTVVTRFDATPMTLVHGDCLPKNIHVAASAAGTDVIPIDWGNAGWGLPASDLGHTTLLLGDPVIGRACYEDFTQALRPAWPACGVAVARELANLGRLLWSIKVIAMSLSGFQHDRIDKVEQHFALYATVMLRSLREWNRSA
jgi:hypothetical protein